MAAKFATRKINTTRIAKCRATQHWLFVASYTLRTLVAVAISCIRAATRRVLTQRLNPINIMATLRLTPQIAFQAARQLSDEGRIVNSSSIYERSNVGGSLGTAQKWANLWHAFEKGEEVEAKFEKFRSVYEAVKRGEEVTGEEVSFDARSEVIPQIEGAIGELTINLSAIVRQLVEEETTQARESSAEVARHERELTELARGELDRVTEELSGLRKAHEELLERYEVLARAKEVLQGQYESLEGQCAEKDEHIERLEARVAELAQKYGTSEARVTELEVTLKTEQARSKELESRCVEISEECATLRHREGQLAQKCTAFEVETSSAKLRYDDERKQRERLEGEIRSLNALLVEKEGRAATAQEKARLLEVQIAALREEGQRQIVDSPQEGKEEAQQPGQVPVEPEPKRRTRKRSGAK